MLVLAQTVSVKWNPYTCEVEMHGSQPKNASRSGFIFSLMATMGRMEPEKRGVARSLSRGGVVTCTHTSRKHAMRGAGWSAGRSARRSLADSGQKKANPIRKMTFQRAREPF